MMEYEIRKKDRIGISLLGKIHAWIIVDIRIKTLLGVVDEVLVVSQSSQELSLSRHHRALMGLQKTPIIVSNHILSHLDCL